jgi:hypothetical protein
MFNITAGQRPVKVCFEVCKILLKIGEIALVFLVPKNNNYKAKAGPGRAHGKNADRVVSF